MALRLLQNRSTLRLAATLDGRQTTHPYEREALSASRLAMYGGYYSLVNALRTLSGTRPLSVSWTRALSWRLAAWAGPEGTEDRAGRG